MSTSQITECIWRGEAIGYHWAVEDHSPLGYRLGLSADRFADFFLDQRNRMHPPTLKEAHRLYSSVGRTDHVYSAFDQSWADQQRRTHAITV